MIPNNAPEIFAYFDSDGGRFRFPIVAWDDQGRALIADVDGRLVVANEQPHFDGLMGFLKMIRKGPRPAEEDAPEHKAPTSLFR